jgi:hypothetical protein
LKVLSSPIKQQFHTVILNTEKDARVEMLTAVSTGRAFKRTCIEKQHQYTG